MVCERRTVAAYGISSWYSSMIFSRMISPTKKRSGCSLTLSCTPRDRALLHGVRVLGLEYPMPGQALACASPFPAGSVRFEECPEQRAGRRWSPGSRSVWEDSGPAAW